MNHATPGNWQASNPQHKAGSLIYSHEVTERGAIVAVCYGDTPEEAKANADLCAAAKGLRDMLVKLLRHPQGISTSAAEITEARALLATLPQ